MRRHVRWGALLLVGCASHPLGGDWEQLGPAAREARAVAALEALVAGGVDGAGAPFTDRQVVRCDRTGVAYVPARGDGEGQPSSFAWRDVVAVEAVSRDTLPARPETLLVYFDPDSPGLASVQDLVRPPLVGLGLARPYVALRSRPTWSRNRMVHALRLLTRPDGPARDRAAPASRPNPKAGPETPAPDGSQPTGQADALEAKLRRLKEWRDQGLIDEADYRRKRAALLEQL